MSLPLLKGLLRNTELRQMLDFVSPAFFQVVPAKEVWKTGSQLVASSRDRGAFEGLDVLLSDMAGPAISLGVDSRRMRPLLDTPAPNRAAAGELILQLYFSQLLRSDVAVLDLSPERFELRDTDEHRVELTWRPRRYVICWPTIFLAGLRDIYEGFYHGRDDQFETGLSTLQLQPAKEAFLRQFGENQSSVRFRTSELIDHLHESFLACRRERKQLSGAFLALGFYLTTLYQSLEALGATYNVQRAFELAAHQLPGAATQSLEKRSSRPHSLSNVS